MFRRFIVLSFFAVAVTLVGTLAADRMHSSYGGHSDTHGQIRRSMPSLGYDQLQYRHENGHWRLTVECLENPYV